MSAWGQRLANRPSLVWLGIACIVVIPVVVASTSPLLQWREPVYISAGLAGVIALALMPLQPLLALGWLPGPSPHRARRLHGWLGTALIVLVAVHVAGLYATSPPDVIDALLFASPTPFSLWGVIAMWAIVATGILASLRRPLRLRPQTWRIGHLALACLVVGGTAAHAILIEGTMGSASKAALCTVVVLATLATLTKAKRKVVRRPL